MWKWISLVYRSGGKDQYRNPVFASHQWVARSLAFWCHLTAIIGSVWLLMVFLAGSNAAVAMLTDWPPILAYVVTTLGFPLLGNWLAWKFVCFQLWGTYLMFGIWVLTNAAAIAFCVIFRLDPTVHGALPIILEWSCFAAICPVDAHREELDYRLKDHLPKERQPYGESEPADDSELAGLL